MRLAAKIALVTGAASGFGAEIARTFAREGDSSPARTCQLGEHGAVADVFRRHGEAFRHAHAGHLGRVERRVMGAPSRSGTAALGGHVEQCDDCGAIRIAYNSCLMGKSSNGELAAT